MTALAIQSPSTVPAASAGTNSQVWDAATLLSRDTWRHELPDQVAREFQAFCAQHPDRAQALDRFEFDPLELPALAALSREVCRGVVAGDGLAHVRGLGDLELSEAQQRLFYLAFGQAMGTPMVQYGRLYPIRDRGLDYTQSAIPVSMTNAETGFHTDSSSVDVVPDFVGLLCETPSDNGGESLVSNTLTVFRQLREEVPHVLDVLSRDLIRDVVTPGSDKNQENLLRNRFPIFAPSDRPEGLLCRYMRYWIEKGQTRAGAPLAERELAALDTLDRYLSSSRNVVSFRLEAGDILWVNNRTLTHNRREYRDTPGNQRQLQRMWIQL